MKRIISLLTLYVCIVASAVAQFQNPVTFSVTQKKVADDALEIVFQGTVDGGWHVYSTDIADGGPTRAELTIEKQKGLKPNGKLRATGKVQKAMDDMFGMELSYMEGTASFVQRFTITEPEYEVAGYLTYGACNDENCIPPTNVEFSFKGKQTLSDSKTPSDSPVKGEEKDPTQPPLKGEETITDTLLMEKDSLPEVSPLGGDLEGLGSLRLDEIVPSLIASYKLSIVQDELKNIIEQMKRTEVKSDKEQVKKLTEEFKCKTQLAKELAKVCGERVVLK